MMESPKQVTVISAQKKPNARDNAHLGTIITYK